VLQKLGCPYRANKSVWKCRSQIIIIQLVSAEPTFWLKILYSKKGDKHPKKASNVPHNRKRMKFPLDFPEKPNNQKQYYNWKSVVKFFYYF
jgi:hypothetical protein